MRRIVLPLMAVSACYAQGPCSYLVSHLQLHELYPLASLGIASISLKYTLTDEKDDNGNILWLSSESFKVDRVPAKTCDVMLDADSSI